MKTLKDYIAEAEYAANNPIVGDDFGIEVSSDCLLETYVCDETRDGIVLYADEKMMSLLEEYGFFAEEGDLAPMQVTNISDEDPRVIAGASLQGYISSDRDFLTKKFGPSDSEGAWLLEIEDGPIIMLEPDQNSRNGEVYKIISKDRNAQDYIDAVLNSEENLSEGLTGLAHEVYQIMVKQAPEFMYKADNKDVIRAIEKAMSFGDNISPIDLASYAYGMLRTKDLNEAEYQGRKVPLGKPMKGDVKKSKVYVKGPKGNVVKVNFGDKNMRIKKNIPGRRKNFRARHNCDNPGPRWKARYWSCRAW